MSWPKFIAAIHPYHEVGWALMSARAPAEHAPPGYNDARGALWARLQAKRRLPTSSEFEAEWRRLRGVITAAGGDHHASPLHPAAEALDHAWGAATAAGLLDRWEVE